MIPISTYASGRVELLGNHTDYNLGVVLAAAIDRGVTVSGAKRSDDVIGLSSSMAKGRVETRLQELRPSQEHRWINYALGVVQEFVKAGHQIHGFNAEVSGNLPIGAGLSSSAAFEVATAYFLMRLFDLELEPLAVAKLCQRAENEFVGVRSGLLDQVTSVFGRADHVVYLDCQNEEVRTIAFPPQFALIIADSGSEHSLVADEYNARRDECAAAAAALGVASLREVTLQQLNAARGRLDPLLFRRAMHIVGENDRVWRAIDAMSSGNAAELGRLMKDSHKSSRMNFENSTPALDALVSAAQAIPGVLGSRLTGGGFGGGTVTLVPAPDAEQFAEKLNEIYREQSGRAAGAFVCRIADGAAVRNAG
ncbi:MAG: galactokinase [Chthoniobacterales bacterium]